MLDTYLRLIDSQVFWTFAFLVLFLLASYLIVVPSINAPIRSRQNIVNKYLRDAEILLLNAKAKEHECEEILKMTSDDTNAMIANAQEENFNNLREYNKINNDLVKEQVAAMKERLKVITQQLRVEMPAEAEKIADHAIHSIFAYKLNNIA